jgi:hypothetical protein
LVIEKLSYENMIMGIELGMKHESMLPKIEKAKEKGETK